MARTKIPIDVKIQVLTESGYRCAVPTCRNILAIDMHHMVEVKDKGPNEASNLLSLCPTCHALYTRGTISKESIDAWKTMLVALNHAFDRETISNLLFLYRIDEEIARKTEDLMKDDTNQIKKIQQDSTTRILTENQETVKDLKLLMISGDGVLKFSHLIASGLAYYFMSSYHGLIYLYQVTLTPKGRRIVEAWFSGNRNAVREALGDLSQE